jgi:hypothetical protein
MNPPTPVQHTAPVPNDVAWYLIAGAIVLGAALVTVGLSKNAARWEAELRLPAWFSVAGEVVAIVIATAGGAAAGFWTWHWGLGLLSGLVGSLSASIVVRFVAAWIERRRGENDDEIKKADRPG